MRREQDEAERRLRLESEQRRQQLHGQGHTAADDDDSDRRLWQRRIDAKLHEMETRRMMEHLKVQCTS